jgi:hypothetical protein
LAPSCREGERPVRTDDLFDFDEDELDDLLWPHPRRFRG